MVTCGQLSVNVGGWVGVRADCTVHERVRIRMRGSVKGRVREGRHSRWAKGEQKSAIKDSKSRWEGGVCYLCRIAYANSKIFEDWTESDRARNRLR